MTRLIVALACCTSFAVFAQAAKTAPAAAPAAQPAAAPAAAPAADHPQMTCGQMAAQKSVLPAKMAEMMTALADTMEMHAKALDSKDKANKGEHDMMMKMAKEHRTMATTLEKESKEMAKMKDSPQGKHDMKMMSDAKAMDAMKKQVALEKEMSGMMAKDAESTEKMMQQMGSGNAGTK